MKKYILNVLVALLFIVLLSITASQPLTAQSGDLPDFLQDFIIFYSSGNLNEMWRYAHPDRGLIQNGMLLTYKEVEKEFKALGPEIGKADYIKLFFDEGFFPGENYYRVKCIIQYRIAGYTQQVPTVFIFEYIDDKWYLVQSEKVEFFEQFRPLEVLTVGYILPDIEIETNTGRLYKSSAAAEKGKATFLYFFTLLDLFREENTAFFMSIVKEFGQRDDLYIFGVTDDNDEYVKNWMEDENIQFVWLYDGDSLLHYDLGILTHPMILLLDGTGRLVLMSSWEYDIEKLFESGYFPSAHDLIRRRIREVLSESADSD